MVAFARPVILLLPIARSPVGAAHADRETFSYNIFSLVDPEPPIVTIKSADLSILVTVVAAFKSKFTVSVSVLLATVEQPGPPAIVSVFPSVID